MPGELHVRIHSLQTGCVFHVRVTRRDGRMYGQWGCVHLRDGRPVVLRGEGGQRNWYELSHLLCRQHDQRTKGLGGHQIMHNTEIEPEELAKFLQEVEDGRFDLRP